MKLFFINDFITRRNTKYSNTFISISLWLIYLYLKSITVLSQAHYTLHLLHIFCITLIAKLHNKITSIYKTKKKKKNLKRGRASSTPDSGNRLRKFRFFRGQSRVTFSTPGLGNLIFPRRSHTHRRGKNRIPLSAKGERVAPF